MKNEKQIIAGLAIWTFIHLVILVISEQSLWGGEKDFYPFTDRDSIIKVYDFSEFFFYVGGVWLAFFLYKYLNKKEDGI